jgi:WS/DGAT/MGAT family acyltransferase
MRERRRTITISPWIATGLRLYSEMLWLFSRGIASLLQPASMRERGAAALSAAAAVGKLVSMRQGTSKVFNGPLGVEKRFAWSDPIPLQAIRTLRRYLGASVHEVLLSAVAGALRRYLEGPGASVSDVILHVALPVNMRRQRHVRGLGNQFGLNLLELPLDRESPVERVSVIRQRLQDLKASREAEVVQSLMDLYGITPVEITSPVIDFARKKVTAVVSAVAGPPKAVRFAGKPIERMMFWVPQSGRLGLSISLLTYKGAVTVGVASDAGLVPDPRSIVLAFRDELLRLLAAVSLPLKPRDKPGD